VLPLAAALAAVVLVATLFPTFTQYQTRHLSVLPFNCPGTDGETELLCAGLLDTVTAKLTEMQRFESSLSVVPVSEVRGQRVISADMARRIFGVDLVVTGSVLREEASIRIPIELIDAARLRQIRSRTITAEDATDFVLQDRVIAVLEEMLDVEFGAAERQAMMTGGTSNAEAAGLFLEARGYAGKTPTEVHLSRAMNLYREALEIDPEYADALVQLSDACDQRYQFGGDSIWMEHGAKYAQRAVALAPELPAAQLAAGRFNLQDSLYEDAIEHLQKAIALDPLGLEAYMYLAQAYEETGEPDLAEEAVKRAIRTGPEDWQTYYDLGKFFYDRHEWERAAGYFREVVRLLPESSIGYTGLGSALFYLGDRDQARETLERGVAIGSGYEGYNNLATLEFYDARYAEAATLYERALELDDGDHQVWNNLAEVLVASNANRERILRAWTRSAELAEQNLATDPDNVTVMIKLASTRIELGEEDEARRLLARALDHEITNPNSMIVLADLFEKTGDRSAALAWIERALEAGYPLQIIENYKGFHSLVQDPAFGRIASTYDDLQNSPSGNGE